MEKHASRAVAGNSLSAANPGERTAEDEVRTERDYERREDGGDPKPGCPGKRGIYACRLA